MAYVQHKEHGPILKIFGKDVSLYGNLFYVHTIW